VHRNGPYLCKFKNTCVQSFNNTAHLVAHIKAVHNNRADLLSTKTGPGSSFGSVFTCCLDGCGDKLFPTYQRLISHFWSDHKHQQKVCIFDSCEKFFDIHNSLLRHIKRSHAGKNHNIKPAFLRVQVQLQAPDLPTQDLPEVLEETSDSESDAENDELRDHLPDFDADCQLHSEETYNFQQGYADFLNRLLTFHFVPLSLTAKLNGEIKTASIFSQVNSSQDHVRETFDLFRTPFRIEKYMEKNFHLVLPQRVPLGSGDFQYVSVVNLLKEVVADKSFQKVRQRRKTSEEDVLEDVEDGLFFKNHEFFLKNPNALR